MHFRESKVTCSVLYIFAATPGIFLPIAAQATASVDTITVVAAPPDNVKSGGDTPVPAYLDGHVANGARMGVWGEQKAENVPFNVVSYTAKMIEDTQAQTLTDVLRHDASVQAVRGYGNFGQSYRIRGFLVDGDDISYGGLYGVLPRQVVSTDLAERVEVIKGSSAFINGVPSGGSGVGGAINVEPKRAADEPVNKVKVDYRSRSQIGGTLDAGRRFGADDRFGARVNLMHREGETGVHKEKNRETLATLGLDYRGDSFRSSLDMGWTKSTIHHGRIGAGVGKATDLNHIPDNHSNYGQSWVYSDMMTRFAAWRGEYDLTSDWTWYTGFGGSETDERGEYSVPKLLDNAGNATASRLGTRYKADQASGMTGIRGRFATGFIDHNINMGYSGVYRKTRAAYTLSGSSDINIYHPHNIDYPQTLYHGGSMDSPKVRSRVQTAGVFLSDTLSALDERLQLTLGARRQTVTVRNYSYTGAEDPTTRFDAQKVTPVYGLLVKPWQNVSLYANHIEALQSGPVAPSGADIVNAGTVAGIVVSKQNEVGIKADFGRISGSLALFEIKRPVGTLTDTGGGKQRYGLNGEQRNRGVELNLAGELVYGVRLLASAQWLEPELFGTEGGVNNGHDAIGVPRYTYNLGGEWDLPWLNSLTATGNIIRSGSQYVNASNSVKVDGYTRLDLGLRYSTQVNSQTLTWRANVENVTNEKYWDSVDDSGTYVYQSYPRTLRLSMTVDF